MKKILLILAILPAIAFSQVRIGGKTEPKGMLDVNPDNGKKAVSGLVLPKVGSVDTINIAADGQPPRYYPSVVTPDATYSTQTVSGTDDEGNLVTNYYCVPDPAKEAPAGTIVYDESTDGIRWKKSSKLGDWSSNIVDKTLIQDNVNYYLLGGADFKVAKVSCGYHCSAVISASDSSVYTAGENAYYRTGKGNSSGSASWGKILDGPAIDVSMGYRHGIAVLSNGDVYVWGYNYYGKTGRGTASGNTMTPAKAPLPNGEKALRCEADLYNSLVLAESGNVYSCGRNLDGRNGNGENSGNQTSFQKITFPNDVKIKDIKMSGYMCGALGEDGKIYVWGYGGNGRLGTGNSNHQLMPVMLDTPTGVKFKIFGISTTQGFAFTTDNKLYRWGYNNSSMLPGLGISNTGVKPTEVIFSNLDQGENVVCAATIKSYYGYLGDVGCMMFATDHGRLFASGQNNSDKLGVANNDGSRIGSVSAFKEVQNHGIYAGTVFTGISIGPSHTLVSTSINTEYTENSDNVAYVCGTSSYKDFGDGRTTIVFTKLKK